MLPPEHKDTVNLSHWVLAVLDLVPSFFTGSEQSVFGSTCSLQERLMPACARHYSYMGFRGSNAKVVEQHSTSNGNVTGKVFAKV